MFKFRSLALLALLATVPMYSADSFAKDKAGASAEAKYPEIKETGVGEFDPTFMKAKAIHNTLQTAEDQMHAGNKSLAAALKVPETTSLDEMLTELSKRADKKVTVAIEKGRLPKLKATDAVPSDVQTGIDALNKMIDELGASLEAVESMPEQVTALVGEVSAFPGQISPDLFKKNNITVTDVPKVTKLINGDVKAVQATPERVKGVTDQTMNLFSKVNAAFAQ